MPSAAGAAAAPPPPPPPPPSPSPAEAVEAIEKTSGNGSFAPPAAAAAPLATASPIQQLPEDVLQNVLGRLPLREALACRPACRAFRDALSSPPFLASLPPLRLLALRHPRAAPIPHPSLHALDPSGRRWLRIPLSFLPFSSSSPIAASPSLLYLWVETSPAANAVADPATSGKFRSNYPSKSLAVCNPLTGSHRLLPPLGSAWVRHGTVLAGPAGAVLVLTELAAVAHTPSSGTTDGWHKFTLNLPSKPRSPILMAGAIFALCYVGNLWHNQWKVFSCLLSDLGSARAWAPLDRQAWGWGDLKRPRLIAGAGGERILMIGGLTSSCVADAPCSTVLILRLDLATMEWDEAGRMPPEMYRCFTGACPGTAGGSATVVGGNNKVKVFGGHGRVWFSGKRVRGKLAMWEEVEVGEGGGRWSWVEGLPGYNEGVYRGFVFDAGFTAMP